MNSAADALATLRARLEALEARAEARRAREQIVGELPVAHVADPADVRAKMVAEAVADLAAVELAPKPRRKARPEVAPEYREQAQESAAPVSNDDGGHSTAAGTEPERVEVGASAGNPEGSSGVGAAPQSEPGACPPVSLARVPGSSPGRRAYPKLPQAVAREDWRARWERIERTALRASLAPVRSVLDPFAWALARAGPGALG